MSKATFYNSCVNWSRDDVHAEGGLVDMVQCAEQVTRHTFCQHVDNKARRDLERKLGYELHPRRGLMMVNDYHVGYYRSTLHGRRCYFFKHSAIEYVFTFPEQK